MDAPENTVAAFLEAERQGADGIECDVRLCRSGEVVVFHDVDLRRMAGLPVAVRALPLSELRKLRVGADAFPSVHATIPTIEEAVASVADSMLWNVELKVDRHEEAEPLAEAVVRWALRSEVADRLLLSSFHPLAILTCRKLAPELATAYLWEPDSYTHLWHAFWAGVGASAAVHPHVRSVSRRTVERWHRQGYCVNAWVANEPGEIRRLDEAGVDGIITDAPARAKEILYGDSWTSTGRKRAASQETSS
jgi:glycerophosphoryl diester phosphodiesterase